MKKFLIAVLLLASSAAQAETLWVGEARVIATNPECDYRMGESYRATYRPKGATGNGANSNLAIFSIRSGWWMTVPNNTFRNNVNYSGKYWGSSLDFFTANGAVLNWEQSVAFGDSANVANVEATITNAFAQPGCTVTFWIAFTQVP